MNRRLLTVAFASVLLASCGSPADQITFKAPANWNSTPGIMGRFQMWMNNGQVVMLIRGDKNMTIADAEKSSPSAGAMDLGKAQNIKICGGSQDAQSFTGQANSTVNGKKEPKIVEGILSDVAGARYLAMYIRPLTMKTGDAQAEDAIHSLCAK
ncbi:MAG TPA: hypothetical protein VGY57_07070 [Vicinamibacterales bacterium]|jgi:hypothetical protein|nr:hypothetical protein [Vicinamibacterales bacterium]